MESFRGNRVFTDMEKPHEDLHRFAKEAAEAYARGNISAAEEALVKMDQCSKAVMIALESLKRVR